MDYTILFIVIILLLFGTVMIYSAGSYYSIIGGESTYSRLLKQFVVLTLSVFVFYFTASLPSAVYYKSYKFIYFVNLLLLVAVFFFPAINDSHSWIPLPFGVFNLQPAELFKLTLIIFFARYFQIKKDRLGNFKTAFLIPLYWITPPLLLVAIQPDPGTALIIVSIFGVILLFSHIKLQVWKKIVAAVGVLVVVVVLASQVYDSGIFSRALSRFDYQEPCTQENYRDSGYQVCNAIIAINNSGIIGKGLGNSQQKNLYLPEAHTDAISAVIVEELGLVFLLLLIVAYATLIYRLIKYSMLAHTQFQRLSLIGIATIFTFHILINLGGITALIPLTGVPLPFISYGGTFTLISVAAIGFAQSIIISIRRELK